MSSTGPAADVAGDDLFFATTDAIARIGLPPADETKEQVCGAAAGGSSATVSATPEVNFSGPKRKGISGIHVLAPQGHGYIETSTSNLSASCDDVLDPTNEPDVRYHEKRHVDDVTAGTRYLLCSKEVRIRRNRVPAGDATQGAVSQVVPSVWDNPDIDGVVLRVLWKDFQYHDGTAVVTVWDDIDREFREAIKHGKMISINMHAGEDIPDFIFNDYVSPVTGATPAESNVEPVSLRDFGSEDVTPATCGRELRLGSPNDPNYAAKIEGLYDALADHVKADARFFQALGYVKVTGLNLFTGESAYPAPLPGSGRRDSSRLRVQHPDMGRGGQQPTPSLPLCTHRAVHVLQRRREPHLLGVHGREVAPLYADPGWLSTACLTRTTIFATACTTGTTGSPRLPTISDLTGLTEARTMGLWVVVSPARSGRP